jgi:hypothetical protein
MTGSREIVRDILILYQRARTGIAVLYAGNFSSSCHIATEASVTLMILSLEARKGPFLVIYGA